MLWWTWLACANGPSTPGTGSLGSGTVAGTLDGHPFDHVEAAWLAGAPDDASTTVLFVLDAPVTCDELSEPGWDTRIEDGTFALEIKLIGQDPGDYPVPADGRPSGGESDDNLTLTSTTAAPSEVSATEGVVTLADLVPEDSASGSFDLVFPTGTIAGSFEASFCPGAHEP
ncbi:MAG: hypothetical protein KC621_32625 [Myxococcales bacterium]|nr:hypothetical protein [Myxococcales bacterium]